MKSLLQRFWALSWLPKLLIIGAALFILLMLTQWGRDKVFNVRSWFFDKQQNAKTERELQLEKTSEEAIKRAEKAEAIGEQNLQRAVEAEAKEKALLALIDERGGAIEREADRLEKELEQIHKQDGTCAQIADEKARVACLCAKLKAKGFDCG